jgi:hypothetical protein
MDWTSLDSLIPWVSYRQGDVMGARSTVVAVTGSWGIEVGQPGVHWDQTYEPGGDYVIRVTSRATGWRRHAFTHVDLFEDIEAKRRADEAFTTQALMPALIGVIAEGRDPDAAPIDDASPVSGLEPRALLVASQCLALCEHRRFRDYEPAGGRCLPARYAVGIAWGHWSAARAAAVVRSGLRGLYRLRRDLGREPTFRDVLGTRLADPCCNEPR